MSDDQTKAEPPKLFPILGEARAAWIPWSVIAPHGGQAKRNHYQTLESLAQRGGLAWSEAAAVLEDRPWRAMPGPDARKAVETFVDAKTQHTASLVERDAEIARLRALVTRLTDVAENLASELSDPGTEALAAIHCGRHFIYG